MRNLFDAHAWTKATQTSHASNAARLASDLCAIRCVTIRASSPPDLNTTRA
jgi:hypothetical protein